MHVAPFAGAVLLPFQYGGFMNKTNAGGIIIWVCDRRLPRDKPNIPDACLHNTSHHAVITG